MASNLAANFPVVPLTTDQVHAMVDAGIVREGEPIELIEGLLVYKDRSASGESPMTIGKKHNLAVKLLVELNAELANHGCHMQTQGPLTLSLHSEPEPDGAVLRGSARDYADRLPCAADASSVIEVADSSLPYDRKTKLALYARAPIAQYVIVNIKDDCVEVHEQPSIETAQYGLVSVRRRGETFELRIGEMDRLEVLVDRLLP
jgi:Uma2 family endonuclease